MTADEFIVVQWFLKIYLHVEELPWGDVVVWAQHCMENTEMGGQAFRQLTPISPRVTLCLLTSVFVKVAVGYWTSPNFKVSLLHHNLPSWFELSHQLTWRCISVFDRLKSLQLQPAPLKVIKEQVGQEKVCRVTSSMSKNRQQTCAFPHLESSLCPKWRYPPWPRTVYQRGHACSEICAICCSPRSVWSSPSTSWSKVRRSDMHAGAFVRLQSCSGPRIWRVSPSSLSQIEQPRWRPRLLREARLRAGPLSYSATGSSQPGRFPP